MVQESLANVLQHAPGTAATLTVAPEGDRLVVTVENAAPALRRRQVGRRRGLGTLGMAERARAVGGTLDAGPTATGGWR